MSKGRNKNLIKKRNEALIRRYYYWTEVRRRRFDDVLKILSEEEFFLSEERILSIIREAGNQHEKTVCRFLSRHTAVCPVLRKNS